MSELRDYKITDEEYEKILRARKRLATKMKEEEQEIVQGYRFGFHGWDSDTATFMILVEKVQVIKEMDIYTKNIIWRRVGSNAVCGLYTSLDVWKKALDENTKNRYYEYGIFIPETELSDETLKFVLQEFKNYKNVVIPESIRRDQAEIDYYQRGINNLQELIKIKKEQLEDASIDAFLNYSDRNDPSVYKNWKTYSKIESKNFIKTIKGGE